MDEYHKLERKSALSGRFIKGWVSYLFNKMDTNTFHQTFRILFLYFHQFYVMIKREL